MSSSESESVIDLFVHVDKPPIDYGPLIIRDSLTREFLVEFLGTALMMIIGDGAAISFSAAPEGPLPEPDAFGKSLIACVAVVAGIAIGYRLTGGLLNPALTFSLATAGRLKWYKVPIYIMAQLGGAFLGAVIVYLAFARTITMHLDRIGSVDDTLNVQEAIQHGTPKSRYYAYGSKFSAGISLASIILFHLFMSYIS